MPWYSKQLKAILNEQDKKKGVKKREPKKDSPAAKKTPAQRTLSGQEKRSRFSFSSPVAQRNRNRPKTDLY